MTHKRKLKRTLSTIEKTEKGYELVPPEIKGMVWSGGGGKGIGYAGMIKALYKQGVIKGLTHVCGASAGAMTASLVALSTKSEDILNLLSNLNIANLLDVQGIGIRATGARFQNVLDIIYILQIKEHIKNIEAPTDLTSDYYVLKQKINIHKKLLAEAGIQIDSIEDVIKLSNNLETLKKLDEVFATLPKEALNRYTLARENPKIVFSDLARLRNLLPNDKKHLIKNLSVVTTNQTKGELETYNESENAKESISARVQQSGAHPLLFTPTIDDKGESIADGGIIDNMPTKVLEKQGLKPEQIFCAGLETEKTYQNRVATMQSHIPVLPTRGQRVLDMLTKPWLGAHFNAADVEISNREKVYYHLDNMIVLNSKSITTTTTAPTPEQKKETIDTAFEQTDAMFRDRIKSFDNPLTAMLYLGRKKLNATMENTPHDGSRYTEELFEAAAQAKRIFLIQKEFVKDISMNDFNNLQLYVSDILSILKNDAHLNETQQKQAMGLILKQINFRSHGELEKYLVAESNNEKKAEGSSQNFNLFTQLLILLTRSIGWIFMKSPISKPQNPVSNSPDETSSVPAKTEVKQKKAQQTKITAPMVYGMFSHNEAHRKPVITTAPEKNNSLEPNSDAENTTTNTTKL